MNELNYGRAFDLLRKSSRCWNDYMNHAFVKGLGDGSLPRQSFLHYLKQDYIFLLHFARAWALAVAKTDQLDEMKACAATVNGLVNGEMQFHIETCAKVGISEAEILSTPEAPENLAYTRFVLEAGYSGSFVSLLATLAPCVFGYGAIGLMLRDTQTSDLYSGWIDTYAGEDYQTICNDAGRLLDSAIEKRFGSEFDRLPIWKSLEAQFDMATRLEVGFWDMALGSGSRNT